MILRPYYPASELFRVVNDDVGLQADFMAHVDGIRSFEALRAHGTMVAFGGASLLVADLRDIIRSKRAANRPRDRAILDVRRRRCVSKARRRSASGGARQARRQESARALREQIRRLLARPMEARTHFLRVRLPGGGSAL